MKKIYLGILFLLGTSILPLCTYASGEQIIDAKIDGSQFAEQGKNLEDIQLNFCDNGTEKSISYDTYLGKKQKICYRIFNGSDKDIIVNVGFVDGFLTNDERRNKACGLAENIENFGKYVTGYDAQIKMGSGTVKKIYAEVVYPRNTVMTGDTIDGCLVYYLSQQNRTGEVSNGFSILVRKAKFITLHIKKAPILDGYLPIIIGIFVVTTIGLVYIVKFRKQTSTGK